MCTHLEERHHKVVRTYVQPRTNTTGLEQGLAEGLLVHSLRKLRTVPISGLSSPRPAPRALMERLGWITGGSVQALNVQTAAEARNGPILIKQKGIVIYEAPEGLLAGDVYCLATCHRWGDVAFVGQWQRVADDGSPEFWGFSKTHGIVMVPIELILASCACLSEGDEAIIYCPSALR